MICGSENFYKKCIARRCQICGVGPGVRCIGEDHLDRFVHMSRAPEAGGKGYNNHDAMIHDKVHRKRLGM